MALKLGSVADTFKLVSRHDGSIAEDLTDEEFELYQESLDESHLRLQSEPTRFTIKRTLTFDAQKEVTRQQVRVGRDGKPQVDFSFMLDEVRFALVGIENPVDMPEEDKIVFKKDADGFASKDLIAKLNAAGIVSEIYSAKQTKHKAIPEKK
jgi:hypothetical protein